MRKLLLTCAMSVLVSVGLLAQNRTVTGRVVDENGEPLPQASVFVKGTTTGTSTNLDGRYSLNVPASGETLVFRFLGYTTVEEQIGNRRCGASIFSRAAD